MSLFAELKRRNVFRVGLAYAISAWVLLQVIDLVLEHTDSPAWVMHVFMLIAVLGFGIALIVSWVFEVTPEGIKREKEVDRSASITHETAQRLDFVTLGAAMLVVVLFAVDRLFPASPSKGATEAAVVETSIVELPPTQPEQDSPVSEQAETVHSSEMMQALPGEPVLELGVAVLPFENLSADQSNAYFASGVHEDVLTHLSRIGDLKIISRTSMVRMAERRLSIPEIGRQLGVSHVLEGSVRRAGEQVRVTVQLIDAATDEHLWAENFDRTLDDIFAIQSEIALSIAGQLETELSPQAVELIDKRPTQNLAAYELYQQARELDREWLGAQGFIQQRELLEQALELDPDYLDAQTMLAKAYGRLVWTGADSDGSARAAATSLTETIMETWPERPQAQYVQGVLSYTVERDYETALRQFLPLRSEMPNNVALLTFLSGCYKRLERYSEGLEIVDYALTLDPENAGLNGERIFHLVGLGRHDEAFEMMRASIERFPESVSLLSSLAYFRLSLRGDLQGFYEAWDRIIEISGGQPVAGSGGLNTDPQILRRMRLSETGAESQLALVERTVDPESPWGRVFAAVDIAELLALAGQQERSLLRAQQGLAIAQNHLSEGVAIPINVPKLFYTRLAYLACLAGDQGAFNRYRSFSRSLGKAEPILERVSMMFLGTAIAACGNPASGYRMLMQAESAVFGVTDWLLALDPLFAHFFGDLPQFQQRVAALQQPASE